MHSALCKKCTLSLWWRKYIVSPFSKNKMHSALLRFCSQFAHCSVILTQMTHLFQKLPGWFWYFSHDCSWVIFRLYKNDVSKYMECAREWTKKYAMWFSPVSNCYRHHATTKSSIIHFKHYLNKVICQNWPIIVKLNLTLSPFCWVNKSPYRPSKGHSEIQESLTHSCQRAKAKASIPALAR